MEIWLGGIFWIVFCLGLLSAYWYGRYTKKFRWSEYVALFIAPFLLLLIYAWYIDTKILEMFLVSAITGFILEYILGWVYHKVMNRRLWYYSKFSLNGYTSLLSIPLWGIAGVLFWFLSVLVWL
jgi:uncharacterized membrane protein